MTQSRPFFTVIIPAHGRADALEKTLASVEAQSFADFECLVIDDASSDGTKLHTLVAGLSDPRFRYHRRLTNGGGGAARNTGIEMARGAFVAFLDSDDLFLPEKLAVTAQAVTNDPMRIWYAPSIVDRGQSRQWVRPARAIDPDEDVGEYLFFANQVIPTSTMVMSAATARRVRFDARLRKCQDLDFCIRAARLGARFSMLTTPLTIWRDVTEVGRTSRTSGAAQPQAWLKANQALMTPRAVAGFKSTVLAYHLARESRSGALALLWAGLVAGVAPGIIARQMLRCFVPRSIYRNMVDRFVEFFGTTASSR